MISSLSQKNLPLSPAAQDLGLGDQLQNEVEQQLALRRKQQQMAGGVGGSPSNSTAGLMGSAVSDLLSVSNSGLAV